MISGPLSYYNLLGRGLDRHEQRIRRRPYTRQLLPEKRREGHLVLFLLDF